MKYFIYSRAQHKAQEQIANTINKRYAPGRISIRGVYKQYTEILNTATSRYSDSSVIFSTEDDTLNTVDFFEPEFKER